MRPGGEPLPHLANGPITAIEPATYSGGRRSLGLAIAAWIGVALTALFASLAVFTIPWREVAGLTIRYVFLPGYGMRLVYFVVFSPSREFAFVSNMHRAEELKESIETALALKWPEPETS